MGSANWTDPAQIGTQRAQEAAAAAALGRTDLTTFFDPASAIGPLPWNAVGPSGSLPVISGALQLRTGATAGSFARLLLYSDGGGLFLKFVRAGFDWYISARFAIATAITAQSTIFAGAETNAGTFALAMGVKGSVSTANYSLFGTAGAPITSNVAIDLGVFHTHRAWRTGGVTSYQIDSNPIVTGTTDVAADAAPYVFAGNGTDAVDRAMSLVWWSVSAPTP